MNTTNMISFVILRNWQSIAVCKRPTKHLIHLITEVNKKQYINKSTIIYKHLLGKKSFLLTAACFKSKYAIANLQIL